MSEYATIEINERPTHSSIVEMLKKDLSRTDEQIQKLATQLNSEDTLTPTGSKAFRRKCEEAAAMVESISQTAGVLRAEATHIEDLHDQQYILAESDIVDKQLRETSSTLKETISRQRHLLLQDAVGQVKGQHSVSEKAPSLPELCFANRGNLDLTTVRLTLLVGLS
jgi:esterase/lipase